MARRKIARPDQSAELISTNEVQPDAPLAPKPGPVLTTNTADPGMKAAAEACAKVMPPTKPLFAAKPKAPGKPFAGMISTNNIERIQELRRQEAEARSAQAHPATDNGAAGAQAK